MKVLNETKTIAGNVYERSVGCRLNLHELIEHVEDSNLELRNSNEEKYFVVGNPTEYEVFVGGKAIDASKVTIAFYDTEDVKSDFFYCSANDEELSLGEIEYAESLEKMSKEELIQKLLHD